MACSRCGQAASDAYLCKTCVETWRTALAQLAGLAADADSYRARVRTSWAPGRTGRSAQTLLPYDARIAPALTRVEAACEFYRGPDVPLARRARAAAGQTQRGATRPDAPEFCERAVEALKFFLKTIDAPPEMSYFGVCAAEGCAASLYVALEEISTYVACPRCGRQYLVADRRVELAAATQDYLATVKEIKRLLKVTLGSSVSEQSIRRMVEKGTLVNHGHRATYDQSGRLRKAAVYRIGDVFEILRRGHSVS